MAKEIIDVLMKMRSKGQPFAVATVVETIGSVSAKTGSKAVIDQYGKVVSGWVGGGCAESTCCEAGVESIETGQTSIIEIDLDDEVLGAGMPCGGHMRVYIEPVMLKPTLWIMGHGRVAECLCLLGDLVGLKVVVNDPIADKEDFPNASRIIQDDIEYEQLLPTEDDYVVIATQHKGDHESMIRALNSKASYIAMIASRKRSRLVLDYIHEKGFSEEDIKRVMAPSGIDLGARTPEEIAISVISELIMIRREATGMRMRDKLKMEDAADSSEKS